MTANQVYKQYKQQGGTGSFKHFAKIYNQNKSLNFDAATTSSLTTNNTAFKDSLDSSIKTLQGNQKIQTELEHKYIFGVHKNVWIFSAIVVAGGLTWYFIKK